MSAHRVFVIRWAAASGNHHRPVRRTPYPRLLQFHANSTHSSHAEG
ncbi:hypothetical protein [Kribbella monticola]|nr:hypothetical protein [Kribbella monticola]